MCVCIRCGHSSFIRYTGDVEGDAAQACDAGFRNGVSAGWPAPVEVTVSGVDLVLEDMPYMHVPRDEAHLLAHFPLPTAASSTPILLRNSLARPERLWSSGPTLSISNG